MLYPNYRNPHRHYRHPSHPCRFDHHSNLCCKFFCFSEDNVNKKKVYRLHSQRIETKLTYPSHRFQHHHDPQFENHYHPNFRSNRNPIACVLSSNRPPTVCSVFCSSLELKKKKKRTNFDNNWNE